MRIWLTTSSCLAVIIFSVASSQAKIVQNITPLVPSGFRPTVATDDRSQENEEFVETAATQARRPIYGDENYPLQNAIPLVPLRPQNRPHPHQQQGGGQRRPPGPPQQFRQTAEEVSTL